MVQLEVDPAEIEALARKAQTKIDQSLARSGADREAFWHAVALIYRRGLSASVPKKAEPSLPASVRDHLGHQLQEFYALMLARAQPRRHLALIEQFDALSEAQGVATASQFCDDLLAALPSLRAYASLLTADPSHADDLVQETLVKAWANQHRFEPNSNLMDWLCTLLRDQFYSRSSRTEGDERVEIGDPQDRYFTVPAAVNRNRALPL